MLLLQYSVIGLHSFFAVLVYSRITEEMEGLMGRILADGVGTKNSHCFLKLLRSSLQLHRMRLHLSTTYVICIIGVRGSGKSTTVRNIFGIESAVCGADADASTKDVESFYIPIHRKKEPGSCALHGEDGEGGAAGGAAGGVEGDSSNQAGGPIEHVLILDLPGTDDVAARCSLLKAEGYPVADLVVIVGEQMRAARKETLDVINTLVDCIGMHMGSSALSHNCRLTLFFFTSQATSTRLWWASATCDLGSQRKNGCLIMAILL